MSIRLNKEIKDTKKIKQIIALFVSFLNAKKKKVQNSPDDTTSLYQVFLQHVECFLLLHSYDFLVYFGVGRNSVLWKLLNFFNIDPSMGRMKGNRKEKSPSMGRQNSHLLHITYYHIKK